MVQHTEGVDHLLLGDEAGEGSHCGLPGHGTGPAQGVEDPGDGIADDGQQGVVVVLHGLEHAVHKTVALEEPQDDGGDQDDGAGPLDEGPATLPGGPQHVAGGGGVVGGQLHDKGGGLAGKGLEFLQHDAGDDDRRHANEVGGGSHPGGVAKDSAGEQADDGHLGAAGDEAGGHDGDFAVTVLLDGAGGHDPGHAATGSHQHGDEALAGQAEAAEDPVHDEGDPGHVAAALQEGQEDEQHQHLGHEAQHGAHAGYDAVQHQAGEPVGRADGGEAALHQGGDAGDPDAKLRGVRGALHGGVVVAGDVVPSLCQSVGVGAISLVKAAEVGLLYGPQNVLRADDAGSGGILHGGHHLVGPQVLLGIGGDGLFVLVSAVAEEMVAVAEQAIVGPVSSPGTYRSDGDEVNQNHHCGENGQSRDPVGNHPVNFIRNG